MNIPYGRQNIIQNDIDSVVKVLKSDFVTQGPVVPLFEKRISSYVGSDYAVAVNSGTSALHIACLALGVGPGDYVWTSPITFVASANCAIYCGAKVDFVDIDPQTYNMSVDCLKEKLEEAEKNNLLPKVVIPVHLSGQSCEMKEIHALSLKYGFKVIEDASHAIGGRYLGEPVGNCRYSDITVFSFHPVKIITTGEGGMALTNDQRLSNIMQRLRSHGVTRDPAEMNKVPDGPWYYEQLDLGFNYRMTDIQAALGVSQMDRLDQLVNKRHTLANRYHELLNGCNIVLPWQHPDAYSSYHLYIIRIPKDFTASNHLHVFESFRRAGIGVNMHYIPVYRQPYYSSHFNFSSDEFIESERYYSEAISIPIYPDLTEQQQEHIVDVMLSPIGHQTIF